MKVDVIMRACPKLTNLNYHNVAGTGLIPEGGLPFRPALASLSVRVHIAFNLSRDKVAAILKARPNLKKLKIHPCHFTDIDLFDNIMHHLETLHWNYSETCRPHQWTSAAEDVIMARKRIQDSDIDNSGGSPLRRLQNSSFSDTHLIRLLKERGHELEMLTVSISSLEKTLRGYSCLKDDHTLFKRLQVLSIYPGDDMSHEIVGVILGLCDTNVLEHLTLGSLYVPLDWVFHSLIQFSRLHTLHLHSVWSLEGLGVYWKAMADMGDHAPLAVVKLQQMTVTAAQLAMIASVATIKDIGLFSISNGNRIIHDFLLKKRQHSRFQSITLDGVGEVTRDTLIEYIGKIPSLRSLTICPYSLRITNQDIDDFIQLYPDVQLKYQDSWIDIFRVGISPD